MYLTSGNLIVSQLQSLNSAGLVFFGGVGVVCVPTPPYRINDIVIIKIQIFAWLVNGKFILKISFHCKGDSIVSLCTD